MEILIKIQGLSRFASPRQGEFRYSPKHAAFIFTGEPVSIEQCNKHYPRLAEMYSQYNSQGRREYLTVEVIESEKKKAKPVVEVKKVEEVVEPVKTVEAEVSEEAVEVSTSVVSKGRGRYDVLDSDGEVVSKNVFLKKAQELCPTYQPPTK